MACADEAVQYFKDSPLYGLFDNIKTDAGESVLTFLSEYYCKCYGGGYIYEKCPLLFECNAVHSIGYLLVTWGFIFTAPTDPQPEVGDGSTYSVPPVNSDIEKYVKQDTVGRVIREYDYPPDRDKVCRDCSDDVLNQWKAMINGTARKCENAHRPLVLVGGSYYPDCRINTCCGADRA